MPIIARFYGIVVTMYFFDHNPPHLHARYGNAKALISLANGEVLAGDLPPVAMNLVRHWVLAHRAELDDNWQRVSQGQQPEKIVGPDGHE